MRVDPFTDGLPGIEFGIIMRVCLWIPVWLLFGIGPGAGNAQNVFPAPPGVPELRLEEYVPADLLAQGDEGLIRACGCTILYSAGKWLRVRCPEALSRACLLGYPAKISWVEGDVFRPPMPMVDQQMRWTGIQEVHSGRVSDGLPVRGEGVLLGIIDTGVDPYHPDFLDSAGNSAVYWIWDHRTSCGRTPVPYGYGCEWTPADIQARIATHRDYPEFWAHGTGVAGVAHAIAPASMIAVVAIDFWSPGYTARLADAFHYLFRKADSLGVPCVINVSLGDYRGSHDGRDPLSQMIQAWLQEKAGRVVVSAAGNGVQYTPWHARLFPGPLDSPGVVLVYDPWDAYYRPDSSMIVEFWMEPEVLESLSLMMILDTVLPGTPSRWISERGRTPSLVIPFSGNGSASLPLMRDSLLLTTVQIQWALLYDSATAYLRIFWKFPSALYPNRYRYYWRIHFWHPAGGEIHTWSHPRMTGTSRLVAPPSLYDSIQQDTVPLLGWVVPPDFWYTIASGFQCLPEVITVGNFINRNEWVDIRGIPRQFSSDPPGMLWRTSSRGPTRTGLLKPDITAPGQIAWTPFPSHYVPNMLNTPLWYWLLWGGMHRIGLGTSISAPVVAGIVALLLSVDSSLTWKDVQEILKASAMKDTWTGSVPNLLWGYGKVQGARAMDFLWRIRQPLPELTSVLPSHRVSVSGCQEEVFLYRSNEVYFSHSTTMSFCLPAEVSLHTMDGRTLGRWVIHHREDLIQSLEDLPPGTFPILLRFSPFQKKGSIQ